MLLAGGALYALTLLAPQPRELPVSASAERRFFRHRPGLRWSDRDAWPAHLGVVHRRLLPFQHYPYRSPQQFQVRLDVRRDSRAGGS